MVTCLVLVASTGVRGERPSRSEIESHVRFLTSPLLQGRRTGTPGAELAAHYVETRFRAAGLAPAVASGDSMSFLQPFCVLSLRCDTAQSHMEWQEHGRRHSLPVGPLLTCIPGAPVTAQAEAPAVFCGYGLDAPAYGLSHLPQEHVKGRVVVAVQGQPRVDTVPDLREASPSAKLAAAGASGAVALVIVPDPRKQPGPAARSRGAKGSRGSVTLERLCGSDDLPPLFVLEDAARDSVLGTFLTTVAELLDSIDIGAAFAPVEIAELTVGFAIVPADPDSLTTCNVVGALGEGSPCVLVGAHYDHLGVRDGRLYPGADDNASGIAVLLETARLLGKSPPTRGRLVFTAFGAEELRQLGSLHYCMHPAVPCDIMSLMICLDSVGRDGADHYRHLGSATSPAPGRVFIYRTEPGHMVDMLIEASTQQSDLILESSQSPLLRWGSDHWRFEDAGVPVLFYFSGVHRDYHQPSDTPDKLDMAKLPLLAAHLCDILERLFE